MLLKIAFTRANDQKKFKMSFSYNSMQEKNARNPFFLKSKLCIKTKATFSNFCLSKEHESLRKKRKKRTPWTKSLVFASPRSQRVSTQRKVQGAKLRSKT